MTIAADLQTTIPKKPKITGKGSPWDGTILGRLRGTTVWWLDAKRMAAARRMPKDGTIQPRPAKRRPGKVAAVGSAAAGDQIRVVPPGTQQR
jgi:hypothetical protein